MDGFSRKETTATNMKRKLLTMLLVFMVVATYIPFDRAFAADENINDAAYDFPVIDPRNTM